MTVQLRSAMGRWGARHLGAAIMLSCGVVLLQLVFLATTVFAHDCKRDIRRAEDCLRTPGAAQTICACQATHG